MQLRKEKDTDTRRIDEITKAAFAQHPHSSHTEHLIVDALRRSGALVISLVAEIDQRVVGHVAFSPVAISDGSREWYGLGPVSVLPEFQSQGIGSALIFEGLALLKDAGANGCVVLGEPAYYQRFGFRNDPGLALENVPQEFFMALPFTAKRAAGLVTYDEAFSISAG